MVRLPGTSQVLIQIFKFDPKNHFSCLKVVANRKVGRLSLPANQNTLNSFSIREGTRTYSLGRARFSALPSSEASEPPSSFRDSPSPG